MVTSKLKSIVLSGPQVRTLQSTGRLVRFVVMDEQPKLTTARGRQIIGDEFYECPPGIIRRKSVLKRDLSYPFAVGERRWCAEEWFPVYASNLSQFLYRADNDKAREPDWDFKWNSAGTMFHWASRLTVATVAVEAMQIQKVSEEDAKAMGIEAPKCPSCGYTKLDCQIQMDHRLCDVATEPDSAMPMVRKLWDSAHAKPAEKWDANPWCWKITDERVEGES